MEYNYYDLETIARSGMTKRELSEDLGIELKEIDKIIEKFGICREESTKRRWTEKDDENLVSMKSEGKKIKAIAVELERSESAVRARLSNMNIKKEIHYWTEAEKSELLKLRMKGYDFESISEELKRTRMACFVKYHKIKNTNTGV